MCAIMIDRKALRPRETGLDERDLNVGLSACVELRAHKSQ